MPLIEEIDGVQTIQGMPLRVFVDYHYCQHFFALMFGVDFKCEFCEKAAKLVEKIQ